MGHQRIGSHRVVLQCPQHIAGQGKPSACAVHKAQRGTGGKCGGVSVAAGNALRCGKVALPKHALVLLAGGILLFVRHVVVNRVGFVKANAVAQFGVEKGGDNLQGKGFALFAPLRRAGFGLLHNGGGTALAQGEFGFVFHIRCRLPSNRRSGSGAPLRQNRFPRRSMSVANQSNRANTATAAQLCKSSRSSVSIVFPSHKKGRNTTFRLKYSFNGNKNVAAGRSSRVEKDGLRVYYGFPSCFIGGS